LTAGSCSALRFLEWPSFDHFHSITVDVHNLTLLIHMAKKPVACTLKGKHYLVHLLLLPGPCQNIHAAQASSICCLWLEAKYPWHYHAMPLDTWASDSTPNKRDPLPLPVVISLLRNVGQRDRCQCLSTRSRAFRISARMDHRRSTSSLSDNTSFPSAGIAGTIFT